MTPLDAVLMAASLQAASGIVGLLPSRGKDTGDRLGVAFLLVAAAFGLSATMAILLGQQDASTASFDGFMFGPLSFRLDALASCFLLPVFGVPVLLAWYGLGYFNERDRRAQARRLRAFFGLLAAAMTLVLVAADGIALLIAWEAMAITAFFLIGTEDDDEEARAASWVYLVAAHIGALVLFLYFAFLHRETGSFAWDEAREIAPHAATILFVLAVVGFGLKAGLAPMHVWLPGAHATAPSHVSAVLSGVVLKVGVYGVLRAGTVLGPPVAEWGYLLMFLGCASAVFGALNAVAQNDLKRMLAYSSVENVGVIFIGIGAAFVGQAMGHVEVAMLGLAGALLHVLNHSVMKPLAFLAAGSVLHATSTRRFERLGGLGAKLGATSRRMLIAVLSLSAVPPLNGFVSELLVFLALFRIAGSDGAPRAAAFAAAALAFASAVALAAFARMFAATFLGQPRSDVVARAHEIPASMRMPMTCLAIACVAIGFLSRFVAPLLERAVHAAGMGDGSPALIDLAPLVELSFVGLVLVGLFFVIFGVLRIRARSAKKSVTWDCGYAKPSARMQYTASSSSQMLAEAASWVVPKRSAAPRIAGVFPEKSELSSTVDDDPLLERGVQPWFRRLASALNRVRILQQGRTGIYVLYVLVVLVVLFALTGLS